VGRGWEAGGGSAGPCARSMASAASDTASDAMHVLSADCAVADCGTGTHRRPAAAGDAAAARQYVSASGQAPRHRADGASAEHRAAHSARTDTDAPARQHPPEGAVGRRETGRALGAAGPAAPDAVERGGEEREGLAKKVRVLRGLEHDNVQLKRNVMRLRLEVQLLRQIVSLSRCISDAQPTPGADVRARARCLLLRVQLSGNGPQARVRVLSVLPRA